jgi:hypothetical protein
VGAALIHADTWTDGQTDMTKLIGDFRDYAKRALKSAHFLHNKSHSLATLVQSDAMSFYYYGGVSSCKHDGLNARHAL